MNKFRKPHGNGDRREARPRPSYGAARPGGFEKFDAVCADCGKTCQVPFRPNGRKPVYCSDCFGKHRDMPQGQERYPRRENPSPSFASGPDEQKIVELKRQVDAMNVKVDTLLKIILENTQRPAAPVETPAPKTPSKSNLQEAIRKDLVKKRAAKKTKK